MKQMNREAIMKLCSEISKKEGDGSVYSLGSKNGVLKIPRWGTGLQELDNIIGGGMPKGRTIEIFGGESAGKTSLAYHLCSQHEICLDIPIEGCVDKDTEFFNGEGWKKISDYKKGERVLQYNEDGTATLVKPLKYHEKDACLMWNVKTKNRLDMVVSEHHNVVYKPVGSNKVKIKPFHDIRLRMLRNKEGFAGNIPKTFMFSGEGVSLSDEVIRLMVAVMADGSFKKENKTNLCFVGLTKKRKRDRMKMLLTNCGIEYMLSKDKKFFKFYAPYKFKHYPSEWYGMSNRQLMIVLDEMKHWDGCQFEKGHMPSFTTINKKDADFIQFAYTACGYAAYIVERDRWGEYQYIDGRLIDNSNISYTVCSGIRSDIVSLRRATVKQFKPVDGKMYCFTMPSGMWVMRRNNRIIVTGNTFDSDRAKVFGNKPKQMLVYRARYGEKAFNRAIRFAEEGIPLIIIDSVPSMQPKDDIDKIRKAVNTDSEQETRIGGVARLMDKYLPTLEDVIEQTGTTVIFINQIRDKMNALPFGDNIQTPGGHKLKHSCSLRIQVARKGYIDIPNHNPYNTASKETIGMIMKCKVVKSKVCNPKGECEIPLIYDRGFIPFEDLQDVRKEIMTERREKYKG